MAPALAELAFHHFGLAVASPEEAFRYLASLGYIAGNSAFDPIQRVNLAMRHHPSMPDAKSSGRAMAPRRSTSLLSEPDLCYTCPNAKQALDALAASGIDIVPIGSPAPAVLFGGQRVSFHHISGFGLIEILEAGAPV